MVQHPDTDRIGSVIALIGLLLTLSAVNASAQLAIIELHHRPAEEIIPVIAPLLDPTDGVSGQGFTLFVNTAPENVPRVREVVAHLDRAARQLVITVVQGEHALETLSALAVSGRVTIGDGVTVGVGNGGARSGDDHIRVDARHNQQARHVSDIQRVLVQDGNTATIVVGLSEPVVMGSPHHKGMTHHQIVEYRQLVTGVQVTPRVSGNRVTLDIDARRERPSGDGNPAVQTQQILTQVQGHLNEWIDLGAILSETTRKERGIVHDASESESSRRHVFVRVDSAP